MSLKKLLIGLLMVCLFFSLAGCGNLDQLLDEVDPGADPGSNSDGVRFYIEGKPEESGLYVFTGEVRNGNQPITDATLKANSSRLSYDSASQKYILSGQSLSGNPLTVNYEVAFNANGSGSGTSESLAVPAPISSVTSNSGNASTDVTNWFNGGNLTLSFITTNTEGFIRVLCQYKISSTWYTYSVPTQYPMNVGTITLYPNDLQGLRNNVQGPLITQAAIKLVPVQMKMANGYPNSGFSIMGSPSDEVSNCSEQAPYPELD